MLFVLLLLVRLPFYLNGVIQTMPELNYSLIGESLANGARLYITLWEDISPLSAWVFMILNYLFGNSIWPYHVLGFLLVFYQCVLINSITYRNKHFNEGTYVPSLIYGLLMSISFDMYALSPVIMSITFVLLALNNIYRQVEFRMKTDEPILNIGIYLGLATLFYLPSGVFALIALITLIMFSSTIPRRYLLVLFGFTLPILFIVAYYFAVDELHSAWSIFLSKFINPNRSSYISFQTLIILSAPVLLFLLIALIRVLQRSRYSNYQVRLIQLTVVWFFMTSILMIWTDISMTAIILFVPGLTILLTHYFLLLKNSLKAELMFSLAIIGIVFMNLISTFNWFGIERVVDLSGLVIDESKALKEVQNKRLLVLGNDMELYQGSIQATPFFDWKISETILRNPDTYLNAMIIYDGFSKSPPEIIIDLENVLPAMQERVPFLRENYNLKANNLYELKADDVVPSN